MLRSLAVYFAGVVVLLAQLESQVASQVQEPDSAIPEGLVNVQKVQLLDGRHAEQNGSQTVGVSDRKHIHRRKHAHASHTKHQGELAPLSAELQRLERKLQSELALHGPIEALTADMNEAGKLQMMIKQMDADEATNKGPAPSHGELEIKIKRLSDRVDRIDVGHLKYQVPSRAAKGDGSVRVQLQALEGARRDDSVAQNEDGRGDSESTVASARVQEKGIDVDTEMPYGELEPFGREDTAQELTEASVRESDEMVDQLERAEVAEEKRAVFRALTRLRGAAITSFDGVARSQTGNIDGYSKVHKWRVTHPLHHLADEESDISKWAFPDNADF